MQLKTWQALIVLSIYNLFLFYIFWFAFKWIESEYGVTAKNVLAGLVFLSFLGWYWITKKTEKKEKS